MMRQDFYKHLKEGVSPIQDGRNRVYFCELNRYYSENVFRNFSIKYTLEGVVEYRTAKEKYSLTPNYFLLSSKQPCECIVDSRPVTRNISIDIDQVTLGEVFTYLSSRKDVDLDNLQAGHFASPDFFENVYPVGCSSLGHQLVAFGNALGGNDSHELNITDETFYNLAEKIVLHEFNNVRSIQKLKSVKRSTKEEALKRLLTGKYYIDERYLQNPDIPEIARHSNLSQFYFFRNFKNAFGITPYQYMLDKRLEHAKSLVEKDIPIHKAASECSYPDVFTFSKAFRKKYGFAPSMLRRTSGA